MLRVVGDKTLPGRGRGPFRRLPQSAMLLVTAAGPGIISGSPGPPEFLWRLLLPKPASDADLSLGARTGGDPPRAGAWRNLRVRRPLMVECVEMLFGASDAVAAHVELTRIAFLMRQSRPLPVTVASQSQQRCATDHPETGSPKRHRPARGLGEPLAGLVWVS